MKILIHYSALKSSDSKLIRLDFTVALLNAQICRNQVLPREEISFSLLHLSIYSSNPIQSNILEKTNGKIPALTNISEYSQTEDLVTKLLWKDRMQ